MNIDQAKRCFDIHKAYLNDLQLEKDNLQGRIKDIEEDIEVLKRLLPEDEARLARLQSDALDARVAELEQVADCNPADAGSNPVSGSIEEEYDGARTGLR